MANFTQKYLQDYQEMLQSLAPKLREHRMNEIEQLIDNVPYSWRLLEENFPKEPPKSRITIYLDDDMIKFFQSDDVKWQARIRHILRAYMSLQLRKYLVRNLPSPSDLVESWLDVDFNSKDPSLAEQNLSLRMKKVNEQRVYALMVDLAQVLEKLSEMRTLILHFDQAALDEFVGQNDEPETAKTGAKRMRSPEARAALRLVIERINKIRAHSGLSQLEFPEE